MSEDMERVSPVMTEHYIGDKIHLGIAKNEYDLFPGKGFGLVVYGPEEEVAEGPDGGPDVVQPIIDTIRFESLSDLQLIERSLQSISFAFENNDYWTERDKELKKAGEDRGFENTVSAMVGEFEEYYGLSEREREGFTAELDKLCRNAVNALENK